MNIRPAGHKDLPAINALMSLSFNRIYAHFAKKSFFSLKHAFIAEEENQISGAINYRIYEPGKLKIGYLNYMAVHPAFRRKGIGKTLVQTAVESIRQENGSIDIYAAVEIKNKASREMILKAGFEKISRAAFKKKYGKEASGLIAEMNVMPWEELFKINNPSE